MTRHPVYMSIVREQLETAAVNERRNVWIGKHTVAYLATLHDVPTTCVLANLSPSEMREQSGGFAYAKSRPQTRQTCL